MNKKQILTVTLNPSLDRTMVTHYLSLGYHNHVTDTTRLHPAGRGVNIARALHSLDIPAHAVIVLGEDANGVAYRALMARETLPVTFVSHDGTTRSNVTILDTGNQHETHVIEKSSGLTPEIVDAIAATVCARINEGDFVVFAGSLPDDTRADTYARMMPCVRERGALTVLSVTPEGMAQGIEGGPDLLAITQTELEGYFNHPVRTEEDILYCGDRLLEKGVGQVLVIQLDGHAMLMVEGSIWHLTFQEDTLGTHSGVKEAVLAGYLAGRAQGLSMPRSLELGGAAAVYTSGQIGSEFGSIADVETCADQVEVTEGG